MKFPYPLTLFIYPFLLLFITFGIQAQNDVILKTDGSEMVGNIKAIEDKDITFVYKNETIEYKVPKVQIAKITFSSGRVEFYNESTELKDHHNKVAVLPFAFIKDMGSGDDVMSKQIQQKAYTIFKAKSGQLEFQDPMTTNRLLSKAGIGNDNSQEYSMGEICEILGVEYLIQGTVSISDKGQTNTNVSTTTVKSKGTGQGKIGTIPSGKATANTIGVGSSTETYSTSISMNIYNDKGENLFSKDHESFWNTQDAYEITLNWLAKRTPFYQK